MGVGNKSKEEYNKGVRNLEIKDELVKNNPFTDVIIAPSTEISEV